MGVTSQATNGTKLYEPVLLQLVGQVLHITLQQTIRTPKAHPISAGVAVCQVSVTLLYFSIEGQTTVPGIDKPFGQI